MFKLSINRLKMVVVALFLGVFTLSAAEQGREWIERSHQGDADVGITSYKKGDIIARRYHTTFDTRTGKGVSYRYKATKFNKHVLREFPESEASGLYHEFEKEYAKQPVASIKRLQKRECPVECSMDEDGHIPYQRLEIEEDAKQRKAFFQILREKCGCAS